MSKALRVAIEELQSPYMHTLSSWHPFYSDMTGQNYPCLPEFLKLMECHNENKVIECSSHYLNLLKCLHKQGFEKDEATPDA